mmetsp:Transcript_33523/g.76580  ORF Transcript_33523/g.76580 Transcript_33523/m.76580 type:complete len:238 (-) Transcript_33523:451-1164(-)
MACVRRMTSCCFTPVCSFASTTSIRIFAAWASSSRATGMPASLHSEMAKSKAMTSLVAVAARSTPSMTCSSSSSSMPANQLSSTARLSSPLIWLCVASRRPVLAAFCRCGEEISFRLKVLTCKSSVVVEACDIPFSGGEPSSTTRARMLSAMMGRMMHTRVPVLANMAAPAITATMIASNLSESGTSSMIWVIMHVPTAARKKTNGPHCRAIVSLPKSTSAKDLYAWVSTSSPSSTG